MDSDFLTATISPSSEVISDKSESESESDKLDLKVEI